MDNRRKTSSRTGAIVGSDWPREGRPDMLRYSTPNTYHRDCSSEHEIKYPGEKTSEESVVDIEETGINKSNEQDYIEEFSRIKVAPRPNDSALREKYQRLNYCPNMHMSEAMTAMQKLQRLKELQMKRDLTERYYSQEMKRLIGEYYLGSRMFTPPSKANERLQSSSFQPYTRDRVKNVPKVTRFRFDLCRDLEPCGTMTTITKLDCGCIQKTTRPIFTTTKGRVQRRNCNFSQDEVLLKLTSSNPPQEHLLESRKDKQYVKSKKRISLDPRICAKIPSGGDQEFDTENEKRNDPLGSERPSRMSRHSSPHRKFSDTSASV